MPLGGCLLPWTPGSAAFTMVPNGSQQQLSLVQDFKCRHFPAQPGENAPGTERGTFCMQSSDSTTELHQPPPQIANPPFLWLTTSEDSKTCQSMQGKHSVSKEAFPAFSATQAGMPILRCCLLEHTHKNPGHFSEVQYFNSCLHR